MSGLYQSHLQWDKLLAHVVQNEAMIIAYQYKAVRRLLIRANLQVSVYHFKLYPLLRWSVEHDA